MNPIIAIQATENTELTEEIGFISVFPVAN